MLVFAILVTMGIAFRREPEAHKRFMLLASVNLLSAPIGRIVLLLHGAVLTLFLLTDLFVAAAQGGVTEGLYAMGLTDMPYRDTLSPTAQAWFDRYKDRYKVEPNIGAVYGHVAADLTVTGLEKAGKDLTLDTFVKGLESIKGYKDIFNGPEVNFAADKHQGASSSFLAVVKGGRWARLTDPLSY